MFVDDKRQWRDGFFWAHDTRRASPGYIGWRLVNFYLEGRFEEDRYDDFDRGVEDAQLLCGTEVIMTEDANLISEREFIDIGERMADELRSFINSAQEAGCDNPLLSTQALVEEWHQLFKRSSYYWQKHILESEIDIAAQINLGDSDV